MSMRCRCGWTGRPLEAQPPEAPYGVYTVRLWLAAVGHDRVGWLSRASSGDQPGVLALPSSDHGGRLCYLNTINTVSAPCRHDKHPPAAPPSSFSKASQSTDGGLVLMLSALPQGLFANPCIASQQGPIAPLRHRAEKISLFYFRLSGSGPRTTWMPTPTVFDQGGRRQSHQQNEQQGSC